MITSSRFDYGFFDELENLSSSKLRKHAAESGEAPQSPDARDIKEKLLATVLSHGGELAGRRIGGAIGRDPEESARYGASYGPELIELAREDRARQSSGEKPNLGRAEAGVLSGLLGAAIGAAVPTKPGAGLKQRLLTALAVGVPAAGMGIANPSLFGTDKNDVKLRIGLLDAPEGSGGGPDNFRRYSIK